MKMKFKEYKIVWLLFLIAGCGANPQNADIGLNESLPEAKITIYQQAINDMGLMTTIYNTPVLKIMTKDIFDNTGTSIATKAEIPRDITEMVKSTLNGIGGKVLYIPYEPEFMQNTAGTGYSDYGDKILPQVVLSGGITEFDRGLVTKGDSLEFDIEVAKQYGLDFADENKASLSSVTLDFNLIDFKTFTGIPRIQAVNGIKLHKATKEDSIGFTVKSATFGAKGEIKKVQGRHAAVRLLVQLSMLQMIGRYTKLPYWRLVPGATRDEVVVNQIQEEYYTLSQAQLIAKSQELLYLHGYRVTPNGEMDKATQKALQDFAKKQNLQVTALDQHVYLALYENVPITLAVARLRRNLGNSQNNTMVISPPTFVSPQAKEIVEVSENTKFNDGKLELSINKSEYKVGDILKINFTVSEPMYVRIVMINSEGEVSTVFPNVYQSDNYCLPGKSYSIPGSSDSYSILVDKPVGTDKLRAIASKSLIPVDDMHFTSDGDFDEIKMANYTIRAAVNYNIR
tara:strand:+ start:484 stop:2019 length:1536 start_codon:yes stop_codon:yes gene_type:complete